MSDIRDRIGKVSGLVNASAIILINAPAIKNTYPIRAFSGPKTTTKLFLPVALSPSWSGN